MEYIKWFSDFLNQYWYLFLLVIYLVMLIVNIIATKKYKTSKNLVEFKQIFNTVVEAEKVFGDGHGAEKLAYVLKKCCSINSNTVLETVETILSSPEKK